jgi:RHS repeat-associated protein
VNRSPHSANSVMAALSTDDANGNTLSDAQGRSYTWDFENRLTQVVVPGTNGGTTSFKYDPFGRRVQKAGPLGTTNYLYDSSSIRANVIEAVDGVGNILVRYTQGPGIDQSLSEFQAGTASYYEQDDLRSVSSISSSSSQLTNTYVYDSFGKLAASTGTAANSFQYTGRESDAESGLTYYRYRYYDPSVGRFLNEDPITFEGGIDFYEYVRNQPLNYNDPFGLKPPHKPSLPPPPVPNPIPNAIASDYAAYMNCANHITFPKPCEQKPKMPKFEPPPDGGGDGPGPADFGVTPGEGELDPNETLGDPEDTLDKLCDCLKEHPLAALDPRPLSYTSSFGEAGCMYPLF